MKCKICGSDNTLVLGEENYTTNGEMILQDCKCLSCRKTFYRVRANSRLYNNSIEKVNNDDLEYLYGLCGG